MRLAARAAAVATGLVTGLAAGVAGCAVAQPAVPVTSEVCRGGVPARTAGLGDRRSQCGPSLDFTPINRYVPGIASLQDREGAVALINGDCTGTLIAAAAGPVVLTAGHCARVGDRAQVAFNVEAEPDGDPLVTMGTVLEQADDPDYALIELDQLPAIEPTPLTSRPTAVLAVIQHPHGQLKVVAEGRYLASCGAQIVYGDLDTLTGSSGAGVLTQAGALLGVHTDGDCREDGTGTNRGYSAARIVEAFAGDVDAVLDMVEQAPGERLDQPLLGVERVRRRLVGLEPVAVVVDAADAVDDRDRTVGDALFHGHGRPLGG